MKLFPLLGLVAARSHRNEMHLSRFVHKKILIFCVKKGFIFSCFRQDQQLADYFSLSPADFDVSETAARSEYEKFLLEHPGRSTLRKEDAEFRFKTFWDNLKRILFYNKIEQGTAVYK